MPQSSRPNLLSTPEFGFDDRMGGRFSDRIFKAEDSTAADLLRRMIFHSLPVISTSRCPVFVAHEVSAFAVVGAVGKWESPSDFQAVQLPSFPQLAARFC